MPDATITAGSSIAAKRPNQHNGHGWPPERVFALKRLWAQGFSASQVARQLGDGLTKGAVIGAVHRLKLPSRETLTSSPNPYAGAPAPRRKKPKPTPAQSPFPRRRKAVGTDGSKVSRPPTLPATRAEDVDIPVEQRVRGVLDLKPGQCRFPCGDPRSPDFFYCGAPRIEGSPYCDKHSARAFTEPRSRAEAAE